jgi:predicted RNase H-like nuclease
MFHLFAKIREVDGAITPQACVFECHPEAAFWAMNERTPLAEPKKLRNRLHSAGLEKRQALLITHGFSESFLREARFPRSQAGTDDVLDACACVWTAARIFRGEAMSFPAQVPVDAKGLRMAIFA